MADEQERGETGAGHRQPARGSEGDRGNAPPETADTAQVEHVRRTIQGADGPIEIEEESGAAAGDLISEDEHE